MESAPGADDGAEGLAARWRDLSTVSLPELAEDPELRATLEDLVAFLRVGSPEISLGQAVTPE